MSGGATSFPDLCLDLSSTLKADSQITEVGVNGVSRTRLPQPECDHTCNLLREGKEFIWNWEKTTVRRNAAI